MRNLPKVYAYSRVFQAILDNGLKSKVAKTRQGSLDEMSVILKKSGMGACEPSKAMPVVASFIGDRDPAVRKSALAVLRYDPLSVYAAVELNRDAARSIRWLERKYGASSALCRPRIKPSLRSDCVGFQDRALTNDKSLQALALHRLQVSLV
jgi:hypothetical protein